MGVDHVSLGRDEHAVSHGSEVLLQIGGVPVGVPYVVGEERPSGVSFNFERDTELAEGLLCPRYLLEAAFARIAIVCSLESERMNRTLLIGEVRVDPIGPGGRRNEWDMPYTVCITGGVDVMEVAQIIPHDQQMQFFGMADAVCGEDFFVIHDGKSNFVTRIVLLNREWLCSIFFGSGMFDYRFFMSDMCCAHFARNIRIGDAAGFRDTADEIAHVRMSMGESEERRFDFCRVFVQCMCHLFCDPVDITGMQRGARITESLEIAEYAAAGCVLLKCP